MYSSGVPGVFNWMLIGEEMQNLKIGFGFEFRRLSACRMLYLPYGIFQKVSQVKISRQRNEKRTVQRITRNNHDPE